jgi:hypothetical protein
MQELSPLLGQLPRPWRSTTILQAQTQQLFFGGQQDHLQGLMLHRLWGPPSAGLLQGQRVQL